MARPEGEGWRDYPCNIRTYRRGHAAWVEVLGDPGNLWFLHLCDQKKCWEPRHIYLGTNSDNLKDAVAAGVLVSPMLRPEVKAKVSAALTGRKYGPQDPEHTRKAAEAHRGMKYKPQQPRTTQYNGGRPRKSRGPLSEEHKAKMSKTWQKKAEEGGQNGLAAAST